MNMATKLRTGLAQVFSIIGDAMATASAIEQGRRPAARHLRGLGIDPEAFRQIKRF
jgi:hypothetical protein